MAMGAEEWRALVHRLEPEARRDQRAYARKVALLGVLGYAVIGSALVALTWINRHRAGRCRPASLANEPR
jgi:hypothetical protein